MSTNVPTQTRTTKPVTIPQGTNFNAAKPARIPILDSRIIDNLPDVLREGVNRLVEPNDKQVFLVTALATLSGVLPNVKGYYDGKAISANLYAFIIGDYGSGKGAMQFARTLIEPIEQEFEARNLELAGAYSEMSSDEKENTRLKIEGLVIPANASAPMFLQILDDQDGRGILFETEGDTLAQTLASDHGNYSDILRKAFHHEGTAMARRTGNERRQIKAPELSVVLTGTPDQFKKLIPDPCNGLFSRFLYLSIESEDGFRDVFDRAKTHYEAEFTRLSKEVHQLYKELTQKPAYGEEQQTFEFTFTPDQQKLFTTAYRAAKPGFIDDTGTEANGVFHRLALINFRIAMLLSVLREFQRTHSVPERIVCTDTDYKAAKDLTDILTGQTKDVYYTMPERKGEPEEYMSPFDKEIQEVLELRSKGMSIRQIAGILKIGRSTVARRLKKGTVPPRDTYGTPK